MNGGVPVTVPYRSTGDGRFSLPIEDVAAAITPRTRILANKRQTLPAKKHGNIPL